MNDEDSEDRIDFFPADDREARPFLHDDGRLLSLHFDIGEIQSRMRRDDPTALVLDYTRTMMGLLLFVPQPASMAMIGLGGGSLPKYCRQHLGGVDITVAEINPHVIALRDAFQLPPDDDRLHVLCVEGSKHLRSGPDPVDVLVIDGFGYDGQPDALCTQMFYDDCRASVAPDGVMVANLHAGTAEGEALLARIARSFEAEPIVVTAADGGNRIVFAAARSVLDAAARGGLRRWAELAPVHQRTLRDAWTRLARALQWSLKQSLAKAELSKQGPAGEPLQLLER